jgi:hypothetical protein
LNIADVKERFDRELIVNTNYHSYTILAKKSQSSFPVIEPILKKNGVPDDFKYLAVIESGLVNVVSNAVLEEFGNLCLKLLREWV